MDLLVCVCEEDVGGGGGYITTLPLTIPYSPLTPLAPPPTLSRLSNISPPVKRQQMMGEM